MLDLDRQLDLSLSVQQSNQRCSTVTIDTIRLMLEGMFGVAIIPLACFGYGFIWLRLVGCQPVRSTADELATAFALGFGTIGWIIFWPGILGNLSEALLISILFPGWVGIVLVRRRFFLPQVEKIDWKKGIKFLQISIKRTHKVVKRIILKNCHLSVNK